MRAPEAIHAGGRFEVLSCLGEGGFGAVYEVLDRKLGERRALKTLQRVDADSLYRFKKEFRLLADIASPNLIALHELHVEGETWFFTMELVEGLDLLSFVRANPDRLRWAFAELATGVRALHERGMLHRDLKPPNVLVVPGERVVLLDFGLVTELGGERTSEAVIGTAAYMSPEQARGERVGEPADWYAVGVMLYEALTGALPYAGTMMQVLLAKQTDDPRPPRDVTPDVPRDLAELCVGLLRRDPARRPRADEVQRRLSRSGAGDPSRAPSESDRPDALGATVPLGKPSPREVAREPDPDSDVFVGRERELSMLAAAFGEARQGALVSVLVRGEPGIGKTALLRQLGRGLGVRATVLKGRCYQQESVPYKAFDGLVDSLTHVLRRLPDGAAGLVPRHVGYLLRLFPVLARVEAMARTPGVADEVSDPIEQQKRAFAALREVLHRLTDRGPVVLLLDDMQWADADSLVLLDAIVSATDPPPLLLVMGARHPGLPGAVRFKALQELDLGPLSAAESTELAGHMLRGTDRNAEQIAAEAAGHPLFIQELSLRSRTEQSTSLEQAIWQRVLELDEDTRHLLTAICVAGAPLPEAVFQAASPGRSDTFSTRVATLLAGKLARRIEGTEGELEPYHDRVRESVGEFLSADERLAAHRGLAEALSNAEVGKGRPELLLRHLRACGERHPAFEVAVAAARRAEGTLAFDQAASFWSEALELANPDDADRRRELRIALGTALGNAGRGAVAAEALIAAAEGADAETRFRCQQEAARHLLACGEVEAGARRLEDILRNEQLPVPRSNLRVYARLGSDALWFKPGKLTYRLRDQSLVTPEERRIWMAYDAAMTGLGMVDTARALYYGIKALEQACRIGDPELIAQGLYYRAIVESAQGRYDAAHLVLEQADSILREEEVSTYGKGLRGVVCCHEGRLTQALELLRQVIQAALSEPSTERWVVINAGHTFELYTLQHMGRYCELRRCYDEYIEDALRRNDRYTETTFKRQFNDLWLVAGDPAGARATLAETTWVPPSNAPHVQHLNELLALTDLALYEGSSSADLAELCQKLQRFSRSLFRRLPPIWGFGQRAWIHLCLAQAGRGSTGALKQARRLTRRMKRNRAAYARVWTQLALATIAHLEGDVPRTMSLLEETWTLAEQQQIAHLAAVARHRYGELVGGEEGAAQLARAAAWMEEEQIREPERMLAVWSPGWR